MGYCLINELMVRLFQHEPYCPPALWYELYQYIILLQDFSFFLCFPTTIDATKNPTVQPQEKNRF